MYSCLKYFALVTPAARALSVLRLAATPTPSANRCVRLRK